MHLNVHMYIMNAFILLFACLIYIAKLICLKLKVFICSLPFPLSVHFSLSKRTLDQSCWHVDNVKRTRDEKVLFPEYNCLVLSPANLWSQDVQNFTKDSNLLNTIFQYHVSMCLHMNGGSIRIFVL